MMLRDARTGEHLSKPRRIETDLEAFGGQQASPAGDKPEDYYLNNCPVELASICVKLLVDVLIRVGKCKSIADVPPQVSLLLQ